MRRSILTVLLTAAFAWIAYGVASGRTMQFDLDVRQTIHEYASSPLTQTMIVVTFIGRGYVILPLTVLACVLFWRAGNRGDARLFGLIMAGEPPIEYILKWAFHRQRPEPFFGFALPSYYSFPSGHALASMLFFGTLAALASRRIRALWGKTLLWIAAVLMIAAIGFSRVYLGVHYPTDVLAGYLAGLIWLTVVQASRPVLFPFG